MTLFGHPVLYLYVFFQPCLLTSGDFVGEFGICCQDEFPRKCPDVRRLPPAEQCRPRPLGHPEDNECSSPGRYEQNDKQIGDACKVKN